MKFSCTLKQQSNGQWLARHAGSRLGTVEVTAPTREEALAKLRSELCYREELCPCSAASEGYVELEVVPGPPQ
jgi:hypothetical protein